MEALEQGMRAAAMKDGAEALTAFLRSIADHEPGPVACPQCLAPMESHGRRSKEVITLLGKVTYDRTYYTCPDCQGRGFPKDTLLDVEHASFSPGVRRLVARSGARESFARAEEDLPGVFRGLRGGKGCGTGCGGDRRRYRAPGEDPPGKGYGRSYPAAC